MENVHSTRLSSHGMEEKLDEIKLKISQRNHTYLAFEDDPDAKTC